MKKNVCTILLLTLFISPHVFAKKQNAAPAANPLIAYWNFDEVVDNKIKDISGNGHDGVISGAVVDEGKIGKSLLFSVANKDVVVVDNAEEFNVSNRQYTIMAWVKPREISKEGAGILNFNAGYMIAITKKAMLTYADSVLWDTCDFGSYGLIVRDKWQHLAVVRNGDEVLVYIDGREVGRKLMAGEVKPSKSKLFIGAASNSSAFFDGWIDELAIYRKALSARDIQKKAQLGVLK